jgi:hypothetical protein
MYRRELTHRQWISRPKSSDLDRDLGLLVLIPQAALRDAY